MSEIAGHTSTVREYGDEPKAMRMAREVLIHDHPWLEPYIKISCEKTGPVFKTIARHDGAHEETQIAAHHCTFQGWEDVEGQCAFSWALHDARTFKPAHHRISRDK